MRLRAYCGCPVLEIDRFNETFGGEDAGKHKERRLVVRPTVRRIEAARQKLQKKERRKYEEQLPFFRKK